MPVVSLQGAIIKLSRLPAALLICYLLSIGSVLAAQDTGPEAINGDARSEAPASGTGLFQSPGGDLQARAWAYSCATCHGAGHSPTAGIPTLAGMPTDDIVKAMLAYASGERPGLLKRQISRGYDEAMLRRIGKWYENLPRDQGGQP